MVLLTFVSDEDKETCNFRKLEANEDEWYRIIFILESFYYAPKITTVEHIKHDKDKYTLAECHN